MKTTWSLSYLNGKMSAKEVVGWRTKKQAELTRTTGVLWTNSQAHGKVTFMPFLDAGDYAIDYMDSMVMDILDGEYQGFQALAEESFLFLFEVMAITRSLVKRGLVTTTCDRMGHMVAIKKGRE